MDDPDLRERRVALAGPTTLLNDAGAARRLDDAVLELRERGGRVDAATLTFRLDAATHAAVAAAGELHLAPELVGDPVGPSGEPVGPPGEPVGTPGEPVGTPGELVGPPGEPVGTPGEPIDPTRAVEVTASLHPGLLGELSTHLEALGLTAGLLQAIAAAAPESPILRTAGWLATSLRQEGPRGVSRQDTFWGLLPRTADALGELARGEHHALVRDFVRARLGGDLAKIDDAVDRADAARLVDQLGEVVAGALRILAVDSADEVDEDEDDDDDGDDGDDESETDDAYDRRHPDEFDDPEGDALMAQVKAALEADGWSTLPGQDGSSIVTAATCDHGDVYTQTFWLAEDRYLVCYSAILATPPAGRLPALFELVARANHHLPAGAFEVDLDDGEVRFRSAHYVDDVAPTDRTLRALVEFTTRTMDTYAPAIRAVYEGVAPLEALAAVEGDDDDDDDNDDDA